MTTRYVRKPAIDIQQPADYVFAFTMRLLNALSTLDVDVWKADLDPYVVQIYANRLERRRTATHGTK